MRHTRQVPVTIRFAHTEVLDSNMVSSEVNITSALRQLLDDETRGLFTASIAIVNDIDYDTQRVEVFLKEDEDVFINEVPIATMFARDGEGIIYPLEKEDEGLLVHTREPMYNKKQERGPKDTAVKRHHTLQDCVFLPQFFFDTDDTPPYEPGQFRVYLKDEPPNRQWTEEAPEVTEPEPSIDFRLDPYEGEVEIVVMDEGEEMARFEMDESGDVLMEALDEGELKSRVRVMNTGDVIVNNDESVWQLNASGLVTINGSEVVTVDGEANDTFLGLGGDIDSSGQG